MINYIDSKDNFLPVYNLEFIPINFLESLQCKHILINLTLGDGIP